MPALSPTCKAVTVARRNRRSNSRCDIQPPHWQRRTLPTYPRIVGGSDSGQATQMRTMRKTERGPVVVRTKADVGVVLAFLADASGCSKLAPCNTRMASTYFGALENNPPDNGCTACRRMFKCSCGLPVIEFQMAAEALPGLNLELSPNKISFDRNSSLTDRFHLSKCGFSVGSRKMERLAHGARFTNCRRSLPGGCA